MLGVQDGRFSSGASSGDGLVCPAEQAAPETQTGEVDGASLVPVQSLRLLGQDEDTVRKLADGRNTQAGEPCFPDLFGRLPERTVVLDRTGPLAPAPRLDDLPL